MAVTTTPVASDLVLVMDNGTGASGQPLTQNRTFKNVKPAAENDAIYAVAQGLISLQSKPNIAVQRRDIVEMIEGI